MNSQEYVNNELTWQDILFVLQHMTKEKLQEKAYIFDTSWREFYDIETFEVHRKPYIPYENHVLDEEEHLSFGISV